jgi:hypothetical protein
MSGERRLHRTKVEQDGPLLYSTMIGFVVLVLVTQWLFPDSAWTSIALFGQ